MAKLVFFLILSISIVRATEKDFAKEMFSRSLESIEECYESSDDCNACYKQCTQAHPTFFSSLSSSPVHVSTQLRTCRLDISNQRAGMEPWCINDWRHFFATSDFKPSASTCEMRAIDCAHRMLEIMEQKRVNGFISDKDPDYNLVKRMASVGIAFQRRKHSEEWYSLQKNKYERLEQWYGENILVEMERHMKNPEGNDTRFSDPVFFNFTEMKKEVGRIHSLLFRNNLANAQAENKNVRTNTINRIQFYLESIFKLQNHVVSNKKETNRYLKEIKELAIKTYDAQKRATNFAYESTHTSGLDGEIVLLDKDLLNLFKELQEERNILNDLTVYTTLDKLQLVGGMRRMIVSVTMAQRRAGCKREELFSP